MGQSPSTEDIGHAVGAVERVGLKSSNPASSIDEYDHRVSSALATVEADKDLETITPSQLMPLGGMLCMTHFALLESTDPKVLLAQSLEQQAKYADLCARFIASREGFIREQLEEIQTSEAPNSTAVGNTAYLALHATGSTPETTTALRTAFEDRIRRWQAEPKTTQL